MIKKDNQESWFFRNALWVIPVGSVLIAFIVISLFTLPAIFDHYSFIGKGEIGDTIGGITAPVFNLIAAVIIFYSFREQLRANNIQSNALQEQKERANILNEYNRIHELIKEFNREVEKLEVHYSFKDFDKYVPDTIKGSDVIHFVTNHAEHFNNPSKKDFIINSKVEVLLSVGDSLVVLNFIADLIEKYSADDNSKAVLSVYMLTCTNKFEFILTNWDKVKVKKPTIENGIPVHETIENSLLGFIKKHCQELSKKLIKIREFRKLPK